MPWTKRGEKRGCKRAESGIDRAMLRRSVTNSFKPNAPFITVNVQLDPISDTRKNLVVTLDKNEVDAEHQAVVAEFTKLARLPGFRPGKAPAAMVLKRFAKDIADEFKQKVITKAYREGLEKQKLDVLNIVKVEPGPIEPGLSAAVTLTVDIRPEFKLPEYTGLPTVVSSTAASDEEVDKVIEGLRSERAEFKAADRAAQKGDYVKLSYEGSIDGKPVADLVPDKQIYGKVPQTWEEVEGENEGVIPGLGRQLAGLKTGEKKAVTVEFPAEFPAAPALAGKHASYAVEVQEIRERVLPAMDEAFFKAQQVDNLDGLKASVRNNLKLQKEYQNRGEQRRQITEALAAAVDFAVPESLVESETQSVLRQFIEENMRRGVAQEQFEKDKKELFESAGKAASKRVKLQLILAKIAEAEKIQVSEKDIDSFIYREAMRSNQKPDKLARDLAKNRDALRSVQQSIIFDKAVDFLVSKATVSEQTPKA
jgi:trigger factor